MNRSQQFDVFYAYMFEHNKQFSVFYTCKQTGHANHTQTACTYNMHTRVCFLIANELRQYYDNNIKSAQMPEDAITKIIHEKRIAQVIGQLIKVNAKGYAGKHLE